MDILGVRQSRRAFRYIFARTLAKDAAPIPNAVGLLKIKFPFSTFNFQFHKAMPYAIYVSPFQGSLFIVSVIVHGS